MMSNQDYDMLYLGYSILRPNIPMYINKIKNSKFIQINEYDTILSIGGTFGYIITKSGAKKLIDYIEINGIKHGIDFVLTKLCNNIGLKAYEILPHIVASEYVDRAHRIDSDVQYDQIGIC